MIRTLLVDDEQLARERLRRLLKDHPDVEVVDEAEDGGEALQKIAEHVPDVVFLDIQMPVHSGIEVASSMAPPRPQIIFCTAFDAYAVDAFEHNAVDYLLKPVNRRRLSKSLQRIRRARLQREDRRQILEAGDTQRRLFPKLSSEMQTLDYYGSCRPAREVGGDYYDFLPLSGGSLGVALGDVSGKGVYAALLMAGLQGQLQSQADRFGNDLESLFGELNHRFFNSTEPDKYATLFYAFYEDAPRRLTSVNAGHPPPLLLRAGSQVRLEEGGMPLGLFPQTSYNVGTCLLQPGDVVVMCSDGLLEAQDPSGHPFGYQGVARAVRPRMHLDARRLHDAVIRELDLFGQGRALSDDLTLVVLKATPELSGKGVEP